MPRPSAPDNGTSHASALVVVPPPAAWAPIQYFRARYHHIYAKWMPHITLLYPFTLSKQQLAQEPAPVRAKLALLQAKLQENTCPFSVTLSKLQVLKHGKSATLYLVPDTDPTLEGKNPWNALYTAVDDIYHDIMPQYASTKAESKLQKKQASKTHNNSTTTTTTTTTTTAVVEPLLFLPHLSLAKFSSSALAQRTLEQWSGYFKQHAVTFTVDRLCALVQYPNPAVAKPPMWIHQQWALGPSETPLELFPSQYSVTPAPEHALATQQRFKPAATNRFVACANYTCDRSQGIWLQNVSATATVTNPELKHMKRAAEASYVTAGDLKIVTYNVLMNTFEKKHIYSQERWIELIRTVGELQADIIAFEEADSEFLQVLLHENCLKSDSYNSWVADYTLTDVDGTTLVPYGQMILVRNHLRVVQTLQYRIGKMKRFILAQIYDPVRHETYHIVAVHLTSNHSKKKGGDAARVQQLRIEQVNIAYAYFASKQQQNDSKTSYFVLGDFNISDGEDGEQQCIPEPYFDAWNRLYPQDYGYTFDPANNTLAALNSIQGLQKRLDRVISHENNYRVPVAMSIECATPYNGVEIGDPKAKFYSDHNAVVCTLACSQDAKHILAAAAAAATAAAVVVTEEKVAVTTTATLSTTHSNSNKSDSKTTSLPVISGTALQGLLGAGDKLRHLQKHVEYATSALLTALNTVLEAEDNIPICNNMIPSLSLQVIGSQQFNIASATSDVDVVCIGNISLREFFKLMGPGLLTQPNVRVIKVVGPHESIVPIIVLDIAYTDAHHQMCSIQVDLQYVYIRSPDIGSKFFNAQALPSHMMKKLDVQSARSYQGVLDSVEVEALLTKKVKNFETFQLSYMYLTRWAKMHGVYSNNLSYIGGFGWLVLLLKVVELQPQAAHRPHTLISAFFDTYAHWNFDTEEVGVTLADGTAIVDKKRSSGTVAVILTLSKPYRNIVRNMTQTSLATFQQCLRQTQALIQQQQQRVQQPVLTTAETVYTTVLGTTRAGKDQFFSQHANYLCVTISGVVWSKFMAWQALVQSKLVRLLKALEAAKSTKDEGRLSFHAQLWPVAFTSLSKAYPFSIVYYIGLSGVLDKRLGKAAMAEWTTELLTVQSPTQSVSVVPIRSKQAILEGAQLIPASVETHQRTVEWTGLVAKRIADAKSSLAAPQEEAKTQLHNAGQGKNKKQKKKKGMMAPTPTVKVPLRTSEEVWNRLRWDPEFDDTLYTIGYLHLGRDIKYVPLEGFREGDVPFHAVWYFKKQGQIVWDRKKRIDLIFQSPVVESRSTVFHSNSDHPATTTSSSSSSNSSSSGKKVSKKTRSKSPVRSKSKSPRVRKNKR